MYTDAETGFTHLRARYYDPATGQFVSRDPLAALTGSAYGYTDGNPLNGTDPLGLCVFGHVHGNSGPCRGTNVATDLKVAGVVLSVAALPFAGAALAGAEVTLLGVEAGAISVDLGAASVLTSGAVATLDCRHGFNRDCQTDLAQVSLSFVSTAFGAAAVTAERAVLRLVTGLIGLASSTSSLMDTCRPGKTIFEP